MDKIAIVAGARPNFMKVAPVLKVYEKLTGKNMLFVHTGQHYDFSMSETFLEELDLRKPDAFLGAGSGSHAFQTSKVMTEFEKWCTENKPSSIVVAGDVNSTMACAITAAKIGIPSAHIESGLRSFDRSMPEEINRMVTDQLSEILFTTCKNAGDNLKKENVFGRVYFVGNPMIDSLVYISGKLDGKILGSMDLQKGEYCLVTIHRPSNVDDQENLKIIADILTGLSDMIKIVFPVHPRTLKKLKNSAYKEKLLKKDIILTEPLKYSKFIEVEKNAKLVLTDSGGVQEETTYFKVPCLTLRPNTERPITVTEGTNELVPLDFSIIKSKVSDIIAGKWKKGVVPELWDGRAGERIARYLADW
ncbi:UDP-N-acetylglucosamine 2-epimerase (non-hydrolyzing) [candidate division WOR-3 bacterium]|nr:UDP-N-acetylglucosamine 2-epimerase (non-hydrolyzing) [candidate division WOR-3 bacterium]